MDIEWRSFEKAESLPITIAAAYSYFFILQASWTTFLLLILLPDLSMIGYLKDEKIGAYTYNAIHNYTLPAITLTAGITTANPLLQQIGLIWTAHIATDRTIGYGLKTTQGFKKTHLTNF